MENKAAEMNLFDQEHMRGAYLAGTDEAGRGPLAGPVVAAAVILPADCVIDGINDSKKLSEKKREALFDIIRQKALAYSIVGVNEKVIDEINILAAALRAMSESVARLEIVPNIVLVDGNRTPSLSVPCETIVKGDSLSQSIAAASILAKVSRDRYMKKQAEIYPGYGFEKHKGYPTKAHYDAIRELGPCDIHRRSFRLYK